MPSVKIPKKSTVEVTTPGSVLSQKLPTDNAVLITIDSTNRVFFSVLSEKDRTKYDAIINDINTTQSLGLSPAEINNYKQTYAVGVPFGGLKQLLATDAKGQLALKQPGIPVLDTLNNQLIYWIGAAKRAFAGEKGFKYLIKGDGKSKFPTFNAVISALKKNEEFKYNLVTSLDDVPGGSEYSKAKNFEPEAKQ
jgi:hypothetical protein